MSPAKKATPTRRKYVEKPGRGKGGSGAPPRTSLKAPPRKQGRALIGASLSDGSALTVLGASRVLQRSEKRVRQFIEAGELVTLPLPSTDENGKRIPIQVTTASVVALRTKMGTRDTSPSESGKAKASKPSQVEAQIKALAEQVQALALSMRAIETANSEARLARERAFELEQRLLKVEQEASLLREQNEQLRAVSKGGATPPVESPKRRRWWQR
jgi:hypothetical protein